MNITTFPCYVSLVVQMPNINPGTWSLITGHVGRREGKCDKKMLLREAHYLLPSSNTVCQHQQVSTMIYTVIPARLLYKTLNSLISNPQSTGHYKPDCQNVRKQILWLALLWALAPPKPRHSNCLHSTTFTICFEYE